MKETYKSEYASGKELKGLGKIRQLLQEVVKALRLYNPGREFLRTLDKSHFGTSGTPYDDGGVGNLDHDKSVVLMTIERYEKPL